MTVSIKYILTNCTSNITDASLAPKTYTFTITPKPGYMFSGVQSYSYYNANNGSNRSIKVDIADPKKPYTFDLKVAEYMMNLTMRFSCIQIPPDTSNTPTEFTHVYNPSDTDLKKLTTDIITFYDGEGAMNVLDIGAYITGLYHVPYPVPTSLIGDSEAIILANKKSSVSSPTVLGNNFTVDLGTIVVTEKYNSNFDYSNTQCFLVCPYTDRIGLQIDDVIEHTLKLKFVINIYNGDCTLLLTSDDKLIYKSTFKIANKIPYIQNYVDNSNKNNTDNILFNDVPTAYVEIIRPKPLNNTIVSTEEVGKVKDYRGFVAIDDVALNTHASYQEQQEIENKLQAGVYINE